MKTAFLSLILLLNLGCNYSSVEETNLTPLPQSIISPTPTPTVQKLEVSDFGVQYQVLTSVVYNHQSEDFGETYGINGGNYLSVRRETIVPQNYEELKTFPELTDDLINDFVEKNKSKEKILAIGDIHFTIDIVDQKGSIESVFKQKESALKLQKNMQWRLKGVVALSRAGFNADHSKSLVYVEFYNPETQLQKKYCLITWKRDGQSVRYKDVIWLSAK